jgi:hypothetical protein
MEKPNLEAAIDAAILQYLPRDRIRARYAQAPGNVLRDKFISPQSSAALAANAFGPFLAFVHFECIFSRLNESKLLAEEL